MATELELTEKQRRERQRKIVEAISLGMSTLDACRIAAVNEKTHYRWCVEDEAYEARVLEASSKGVKYALECVREAMPVSWQAAAWFLERQRPEEFGRQDRLRIDGLSELAESMAAKLGLEAADVALLIEEAKTVAREIVET